VLGIGADKTVFVFMCHSFLLYQQSFRPQIFGTLLHSVIHPSKPYSSFLPDDDEMMKTGDSIWDTSRELL